LKTGTTLQLKSTVFSAETKGSAMTKPSTNTVRLAAVYWKGGPLGQAELIMHPKNIICVYMYI